MNYSELKAAIPAWLHRDDIAAQVPTFIQLAEARFNRELRTQYQEARATKSVTAEYINFPYDFQAIRHVRKYSGDPDNPGPVLEFMEPMRFAQFVQNKPSVKDPVVTITDNQFRIYPAPSEVAPLDIEIVYYMNIPNLSDSEPSNWLIEHHPDIYLFATLVEARAFVKSVSADMITLWEQRLSKAIEELKGQNYNEWDEMLLTTEVWQPPRRWTIRTDF